MWYSQIEREHRTSPFARPQLVRYVQNRQGNPQAIVIGGRTVPLIRILDRFLLIGEPVNSPGHEHDATHAIAWRSEFADGSQWVYTLNPVDDRTLIAERWHEDYAPPALGVW